MSLFGITQWVAVNMAVGLSFVNQSASEARAGDWQRYRLRIAKEMISPQSSVYEHGKFVLHVIDESAVVRSVQVALELAFFSLRFPSPIANHHGLICPLQRWRAEQDRHSHRTSKSNPQISVTSPTLRQRKGLLDLPAEIWSKIGKIVIADSNHLSATAFWESPKHPDFYHQPPIPRTCRILREEPLPQFYSTRVHIHCANFSRITVWLRRIGPELRRCLRGTVVLRSLFESEEHFRQRLMRTLGVELELDTTPTGLNPVIWHNVRFL